MEKNLDEIKKIFEHVSIETFITYFSIFKKNKDLYSNREILTAFENNSEPWTKNVSSTRASTGKGIFKKKLEIDALEYIIYESNSNKLTKGIKERAEEIYKKYNLENVSISNVVDNPNSLDEVEVKADIELIETNNTLTNEQKLTLIKIRIGQSSYRKRLISYWGGCSVSGCKNLNVLIASHIKPYKECENEERFDLFNGLLLSPNYDKLFDKHLITFEESGKIVISNSLSQEDLKKLAINKNDHIFVDKLQPNHFIYLNQHRTHFFNIHN